MGRAEELYQRVVEGGEVEIDRLIESRTSEALFLDFKRPATRSGSRALHDDDAKNLAKAISGFGNSAGA